MKHLSLSTLSIFLCIAFYIHLSAQGLDGLVPVAEYKLINTADDALGLQPPVELTNTPFAGDEGVYCNGIQPFLAGGSIMRTVPMDALNDTAFAVKIDFRISGLDNTTRAVLTCGEGYRWLSFVIWTPTEYKIIINNGTYIDVPGIMPDTGVWHTLSMKYNSLSTRIEYYLDDVNIADFNQVLIKDTLDTRVENYHAGGGWIFKGYMRNLLVFGSPSVTALHDQQYDNSNLKIFPNPANTSIRIDHPPMNAYRWSITDIQGVIHLKGLMTDLDHNISINHLIPGIYLVQVFDSNGRVVALKEFLKIDGGN